MGVPRPFVFFCHRVVSVGASCPPGPVLFFVAAAMAARERRRGLNVLAGGRGEGIQRQRRCPRWVPCTYVLLLTFGLSFPGRMLRSGCVELDGSFAVSVVSVCRLILFHCVVLGSISSSHPTPRVLCSVVLVLAVFNALGVAPPPPPAQARIHLCWSTDQKHNLRPGCLSPYFMSLSCVSRISPNVSVLKQEDMVLTQFSFSCSPTLAKTLG